MSVLLKKKAEPQKRTVIFGGTFDPLHKGHIEIMEKILAEFSLDEMIVLPSGNPPHKQTMTKASLRYKMCDVVTEKMPKVKSLSYEVQQKGKSYTYKTLQHFNAILNYRPFYIIGADSMVEIKKWKKPELIAKLCDLIVVGRGGYPQDVLMEAIESYKKTYGGIVYRSASQITDISSTEIRLLNSFGKDISGYVFPSVLKIIKENKICEEYKKCWERLHVLMGQERLDHTLSTAITAYRLAKRYGADTEKAIRAAFMHDCMKEVPLSVAEEKFKLQIGDDIKAMHHKIQHGPIGALYAQQLFGEKDDEVLSAVSCHTTGKPEMTLLEKIIFVADYVDPLRGYEDTAEMYNAAFTDLDYVIGCKYAEIERVKGKASEENR